MRQGPSDHTLTTAILSDVILTLQMIEIYIFWEGILSESKWLEGDSDKLSPSEFLGQHGGMPQYLL